MLVQTVAPGVTLAAEGGLRPAQALVPPSRQGPVPAHPVPVPEAVLAPTHDPGQGVDQDHLIAGLALDQDLDLIHPPRDVVARNRGALLLPLRRCWVPPPLKCLQRTD